EGRLPRAGLADERKTLSRLELERHAVEDLVRPVRRTHVANLEQSRRGARRRAADLAETRAAREMSRRELDLDRLRGGAGRADMSAARREDAAGRPRP